MMVKNGKSVIATRDAQIERMYKVTATPVNAGLEPFEWKN